MVVMELKEGMDSMGKQGMAMIDTAVDSRVRVALTKAGVITALDMVMVSRTP